MIDFRDREPEAMRLERIEVREKIAASYVKGKQAGQLLADQRCQRARVQALVVGVLLGIVATVIAFHYGVQP
jgi:hypothetical protein